MPSSIESPRSGLQWHLHPSPPPDLMPGDYPGGTSGRFLSTNSPDSGFKRRNLCCRSAIHGPLPAPACISPSLLPEHPRCPLPKTRPPTTPGLVQLAGGTSSLPLTDPSQRATPLSPKEWKAMLKGGSGPKPLLLDVRNSYEWDAGHFKVRPGKGREAKWFGERSYGQRCRVRP